MKRKLSKSNTRSNSLVSYHVEPLQFPAKHSEICNSVMRNSQESVFNIIVHGAMNTSVQEEDDLNPYDCT